MDFTLTTEQQMLSDSVARFLQNEYDFEARTRLVAAGEGGRPAHWQTFAENGWLAVSCPEELGGVGGSAIETAIISQQFGRGLMVDPWLGCAVLATQTLLASDDAAAKAQWLPALCEGSRRLAVAWSEPAARGLAHMVGARADKDGDGFRITGDKSLVLGAVGADAYLVSARIEGDLDDRSGIALFLVEADAPGLVVTPETLHDASLAASLTFDAVPARRLTGDGLAALEQGLAHAICALCAELVGGMERAIEISADYLRTRKQFGVTIGSFQSLQHRMADMAAELELARSMLFAVLASMENDGAAERASIISGAKALIAGAARNICGHAIQLHGGIGMTEECAIGHYFKRAIVADALFGGRTLHEALCAEALAAKVANEAA